MKQAFIAIGGNLLPEGYDDLFQLMAEAMSVLKDEPLEVIAQSQWYETAPVPISDQPWFLNAVLKIETSLSSHDLLARLHDIEADFGRVRKVRNEARILDLDVIDYDGQIVDDGVINLPHPRLHLRAFVLYPIRDLDPQWHHPILQKSIDQMIDEMPEGQDIRIALQVTS